MKILESQNAVLTNYEVYQHLTDQQNRGPENKKQRHRGPSNLETVVREVSSGCHASHWVRTLINETYSYCNTCAQNQDP